MSLVIACIDKDKKEQTIYSDGILATSDGDIISQFSKKIWCYQDLEYNILIGTCGGYMFNRFVGIHLPDYIKKHNFSINSEYNEERLINIYYDIVKKYKEERDNDCIVPQFTHAIAINGCLFRVTDYDKKQIDCRHIKDDYVCIGMGSSEARALMLCNVEIQKIFETVNNINCFVGNVIFKETQKYN